MGAGTCEEERQIHATLTTTRPRTLSCNDKCTIRAPLPQASSRLHYVALNMLRVDRGNPEFGRVAAVFSSTFWSDAVAATPVDTGLYEGWCNATYINLPNSTHSIGLPVECTSLDPSPGLDGSIDHVLLHNARAPTWSLTPHESYTPQHRGGRTVALVKALS